MTSDHSPVYAAFEIKIIYPPLPHHRVYCHCSIILSNIKGYDLVVPGKRSYDDLLLVVEAPWFSEETGQLKRSNDSTWVMDQHQLTLKPDITAHYHLPKQWFRIVILESTMKNSLGSGILSLDKLCKLDPQNFICVLSDKGIAWGRIEGSINISWKTTVGSLGAHQISELVPKTAFGNYRAPTLEIDLFNTSERKTPQRNKHDILRRINTDVRKLLSIPNETEPPNESESSDQVPQSLSSTYIPPRPEQQAPQSLSSTYVPPRPEQQAPLSFSSTYIPRLDLQRRTKRSDKRTATVISTDRIFTEHFDDDSSPDSKNRLTRTSRVSPKHINSPHSDRDGHDYSDVV